MDPNVYHLQPGLPEDHGQSNDGASYLRRLKTETSEDVGRASPVISASQASTTKPTPEIQERRRSPRFACSGSIEVIAEGSNIPVRGTLKDISLHGCYEEVSTPLPVDTFVTLAIDSVGFRFRTLAKVRACYPSIGMGMCFTDIAPEQKSQLEQILRALAGQRAVPRQTPPEAPAPPVLKVESVDAHACLEEIVTFYQRKAALSREEFYEIAKRVRRS